MCKSLLVVVVGLLTIPTIRAYDTQDASNVAKSLTCVLDDNNDNYVGSQSNSKFMGSIPAQPNQFPSQAFLGICGVSLKFRIFCVGSLISPNFVLSHRDCFSSPFTIGAKVTLGAYDIAKEHEPTRVTYEVLWRKIYVTGAAGRGLALLELPENVTYTATIAPIALPDATLIQSNIEGKLAIVCDWGSLPVLFDTTTILRYASFVVPKNELCTFRYPNFDPMADICISDKKMDHLAFPDYGSPLILPKNQNPMMLIGVGAFFSRPPNFVMNVFTRVTYYLNWIYETTKMERRN